MESIYNVQTTSPLLQKPISELTTTEYNVMLMGIVNGVLDQEGLSEIETCLGDGKTEATVVGHAFEDFWHGEWLTGVRELLLALQGVQTLTYDCTHMQEDIATL